MRLGFKLSEEEITDYQLSTSKILAEKIVPSGDQRKRIIDLKIYITRKLPSENDHQKVDDLIKRSKNFLILLLLEYRRKNCLLTLDEQYMLFTKYDDMQHQSAKMMLNEIEDLNGVFEAISSSKYHIKLYNIAINNNFAEHVNKGKQKRLLLGETVPSAIEIDNNNYELRLYY